ncbi:1-phosphatidylinositol 4,5-bisphosphate phosphodiesterase eta-1 [Sciurus carolinensis]|uniref:Phosphoinositide phospholipase C n=1 Tax=Sciurus carolinensis TaxID=30640 RepID=A0AA41SST5_SCICA|nr:1-phosphatidylinositol 4,5-bisphosphate phosphodiesterase eta-1 [Sciurus carolinensis]
MGCFDPFQGKKLPYHLGDDAEEGEVSDEDSADEIEDECKFKLQCNNGTTEHQVESFIRKKLESLLKESQIRDKEDPDSFTVRALLRATHEGLHAHLKQKTTKSRSKSYSTDDEEDAQQNPGQLYRVPGVLHRLGRRRKTMKLCRELSDLVVYTNSVAAQDIVDDGTMGNVLSFSETRAHQVVQQKSEQFMIYNQKQLTRIYPSAYRIDSSNFNPLPYWNAGCQLVALNYQSEGRMMQLNRAKFKANGNCGYVLKPQQMCKGTFNPFSGDPLPANPKKQLILKVISGQQLPKPPDSMLGDRGEIIDPFVEVEIIGLPVDCCKDQTRVVDDNGYRHVYLEGLTEASIFVHITINEIYGKNRQLQGLKGLFNKNPRHSSSESSSHYVRKRSIGDRILRRTASAPAKGRKKSKMGFQEMVEIKDSVSEATREQDGVLRRTTRSLQARPVSMPVDRSLLGALSLSAPETAKDTEGKENSLAEDEDGRRKGKASIKDPHFPNFNKKLSSSSSALLHKDTSQGAATLPTAHVSITGEQLGAPGGRSKPSVTSDVQESRCPSKSLSPRQHLAPEPAVHSSQAECGDVHGGKTRGRASAVGLGQGRGRLQGGTLSQSALEIKSLEGSQAAGRAATSFSLSDVSVLCSDVPEVHSTPVLQESDISHLIDNVTFTDENEPGSSISALIGQLDETGDQANFTAVSRLHGTGVTSGRTAAAPWGPHTPSQPGFSRGKPRSSFLCSTPELMAFPGSENTRRATVACEVGGAPVSKTEPEDDLAGTTKTRAVESKLLGSPDAPQGWLPKSPTTREDWGPLKSFSPVLSPDLTLGDGVGEPTLCVNSGESSLVEVDGESEDLPLTTYEWRREETGQLASPLELKYSQDVVEHLQRGLRNGYCKGTLHPSVPEIVNHIQGVKNGNLSCLTYQGAGFVHNCFSNPDAKMNPVCVSQLSRVQDSHVPAAQQPAKHPPLPASKLPSPCKSKSLGDLTSEDIACNFESKYQCISKSFITTGLRDKKGVALETESLGPSDALTEQLRKLVSFEQEDSRQVLYSKQDAGPFPRALVRKLSSRSQSRVRNIASRAKEKQEASRQRVASPSGQPGAGVLLRSRPAAPAPAGNRHSTGSYIAGYLRSARGGHLEGRGIPEGACSALRPGYGDPFCSDSSVLQTEPSSDDKPEIYFLLRL